MKLQSLIASVLSLFIFSYNLFAQTPEEISKSYFELLQKNNWDEIAKLYDAQTLKEFRKMMSFLQDIDNNEACDQVRQVFFGPTVTKEAITKMTDQQFFFNLLQGIMKQAAQAGTLSFEKVDILGSIKEGEDVVHVVTRNYIGVGEMKMENMEVISYKKAGESWKILLSGKIKGMAQRIKKVIGQ